MRRTILPPRSDSAQPKTESKQCEGTIGLRMDRTQPTAREDCNKQTNIPRPFNPSHVSTGREWERS